MVQTRAQRFAAAADAACELASAAGAAEAAAAPVPGEAAPAADATDAVSVMRTVPLFGALSPERGAPHAAEDAAEAEVSASTLGGGRLAPSAYCASGRIHSSGRRLKAGLSVGARVAGRSFQAGLARPAVEGG